MTQDGRLVAKGMPTKEFFVAMLVRDIPLIAAVIDLVDNCVDGALRLRPDRDFTGLYVRVQVDPKQLRVIDNCGGMPLDIATNYAFRFGRPAGMPPTPHSVGQFGVGMKRALFKVGRKFAVQSTTETERFVVAFDLAHWLAPDTGWDFPITNVETGLSVPSDERGVSVQVSDLQPSVALDFASDVFVGQLGVELRARQQEAMQQGLAITLNGVPLEFDPAELLASPDLQPAFEVLEFEANTAPVGIRLYAGIASSDPQRAGWYVYCNGRMVLGADQTSVTAWGIGGEATMPKYHNRYARFRGYAFFDSDDSGALPWTTTKTSVDVGSPIYRAAQQRMIVLMRPAIAFLNALEDETAMKAGAAETTVPGSIASAIEAAHPVSLADFTVAQGFVGPRAAPRPPSVGNILFQRPIAQIRALQKSLRVSTYREVGERTFDHYLRDELGEE